MATDKVKVLIVDDNKDAAEFLSLVIKVYGHSADVIHCVAESDCISDVEKALEQAIPGLIFLDIGMPGTNGYQVAEKLQSHPDRQSFILVAYTGFNRKLDRKLSSMTGFDFHVGKPIDAEELNALLRMAQRGL